MNRAVIEPNKSTLELTTTSVQQSQKIPTNSNSPRPDAHDHVSMQAIVQHQYGSAEILEQAVLDRPSIGDKEVLIEVHCAGLDRGTWHLMTGTPYLIRILGFGFSKPKQATPGLDVAGRVAAVGAGVSRFAVGDEVFGIANGSFAEYASASEDKIVTKVFVGGEGGNRMTGGIGRQISASLLSIFYKQRLTMFVSGESLENITRLREFLESGAVIPAIGKRFRLSDVPTAMRELESGMTSGKTVIAIKPSTIT